MAGLHRMIVHCTLTRNYCGGVVRKRTFPVMTSRKKMRVKLLRAAWSAS